MNEITIFVVVVCYYEPFLPYTIGDCWPLIKGLDDVAEVKGTLITR